MRLNTSRIRQSLLRLAGRGLHFGLREAATKSWQVEPPETRIAPPAVFIEDELQKIIALSPWRIRETEEALIRGGAHEHVATWAHQLHNVTAFGPFIYLGQFKKRLGFGREPWTLPGAPTPKVLSEAAAASSEFGAAFFGTLLHYDFPLALLCESVAPPVSLLQRPAPHAPGYRDLFKLTAPLELDSAIISSLIVFTDYAENKSRRRRYDELRHRVRGAIGSPQASAPRGVYIRRGAGGEPRRLLNENDTERILVERGFKIIDPDIMTAEQIARCSLDAPVVVAVEGSHISHCIYSAAEDATMLVLQPPRRFSMCYKEFTDCAGQRFAFLVCDDRAGGFVADLDRLKRILDLTA